MPLAEELAMFEAHRQEWLVEHKGQFALVKDGEFSFHETDNAAYECGVAKYGDVDMLIKQVLLEDLFEGSHALRHGLLGPSPDPECEAGCQTFYGGEVRHHRHCPYYPESLTRMFDEARDRLREFEAICSIPPPPPCKPLGRKEEAVFRKLLDVAIMEAEDGISEGGVPIGAALGDADGRILARAHNMRVQSGDPMAHAEIACMTDSGRDRSFRGLILASTLMPCALCAGAAIQFGIGGRGGGEPQLRGREIPHGVPRHTGCGLGRREVRPDDGRVRPRQPKPVERGHRQVGEK